MPRAYHNLSGVCRDIRAAALAAAEGDTEAQELCDAVYDALGLLDAFVEGDLDDGQNPDASASGDESEDESDVVHGGQRKAGRVERVGAGREGTTQHSTRARARQDARPGRPKRELVSREASVPKATTPTSTRAGGRR